MNYNISPIIITEHLSSLQYGNYQNLWKDRIETNKKTKLTKMFNRMCLDIKSKDQKGQKVKK
jgi:hypothetical protein